MSAFPTTRWSLVLAAGNGSPDAARVALERLYDLYWFPLYAYARAQGDGVHATEDLVQGFFAELIERNLPARARQEKGRFRAFLLGCFQKHRFKQVERDGAAKRGGDAEILSWEELGAEERFAAATHPGLAAEQRFDREWALTVLDEALKRLDAECAAKGKRPLFRRLQGALQSSGELPSYAQLAAELGKSAAAVQMEASRLRARYGELLREIVAETVADPADVDAELRYLLGLLVT